MQPIIFSRWIAGSCMFDGVGKYVGLIVMSVFVRHQQHSEIFGWYFYDSVFASFC